MSAGIKANNDGSAAIQVGGTDYITISSAGAVAIPVSLTVGGVPAGGNYALVSYTSPNTWDATAKIAAGLKAIKVTVVGAGGSGGTANAGASSTGAGGGGAGGAAIEYIPAPSIPGPVVVTAGPGTNSFGAFCSATAGSSGSSVSSLSGAGGGGGTGSAGTVDFSGGGGGTGAANGVGGAGGNSIFGAGARGVTAGPGAGTAGIAGGNYGGGGSGACKVAPAPAAYSGGAGAPGIVIIEEFY